MRKFGDLIAMIDIVIPTLNRGHIIEYAIQSILKQSNKEWNLIILDNNSSDDTVDVCRKYLSHRRIKYYRNDLTIPVYENWQAAISLVVNEYYIVLSDDDYLHPEFLNEIVHAAENYNSPDLIIVGRSTITTVDEDAIVKNKIITKKNRTKSSRKIDVKSISNHYATCEAVTSDVKENLHPSMFVVSKRLKDRIEDLYSAKFSPEAHDYFAGVLMGIYAEAAVFIDKSLVLIGGYKQDPYCFTSNKFEYFGMRFEAAKDHLNIFNDELQPVAGFMEKFWDYPYFTLNIMKQTLLTLAKIRERDKDRYDEIVTTLKKHAPDILYNLKEQTKSNYIHCKACGDSKQKIIEQLVDNHHPNFIGVLKNFLKKLIIIILGQSHQGHIGQLIVTVFNLTPSKIRWIYYKNLQDAFDKFSKL